MKVLYISPKIPYPLNDGGKLRAFNQIKHLSKNFEVTSLSFIESSKDLRKIEELKKICSVKTIKWKKYKALLNAFIGLFVLRPIRASLFYDADFKNKALKLTKKSDLIIIQTLRMSQYCFNSHKTILDLVDTPSLLTERIRIYANLLSKLFWTMELKLTKKYEKRAYNKFQTILASSKADINAFGKGFVVKHGTDIKNFNRLDPPMNNIMFLGNLKYPPNVDAVLFFIKKVLPLIKNQIKDVKFYVVGLIPSRNMIYNFKKIPKNLIKKKINSIKFTGYVKNIDEYFSKCRVFVAPLRMGSGLQFKIIDALNYEIPIVTTPIVNQGIEAEEGKEIIIAKSKKEFAQKILELLKDKELRKRIAMKGKEFLQKNYSWDNVLRQLDKIIENKIKLM